MPADRMDASPKRAKFKRVLKIVVLSLFSFVSLIGVIGFIVFVPYLNKAEKMVPDLPKIIEKYSSTPSRVVSSDDVTLFSMQTQYRRPVNIEEVPQLVIDATLAAEDKRFYQHKGVDSWAMLNILFKTLLTGSPPRGGSTLTMQISKRVYTSPAQTLSRKLEDMALAIQIERILSKDQIIELYLNQIFYGESAYGIGAAADVYFGKKKLDDLTIAEAALLARLVRRPSRENPFDDIKTARKNRDLVLTTMREEGMITEDEFEKALKEEPKLSKKKPETVSGAKLAPYFVDTVLKQVKRDFPDVDLGSGGYTIVTPLNYQLQEYAEGLVSQSVKSMKGKGVTTGAMFLTDSDGAVLVHVGGADYQKNQYDVVTQGSRQPGSSFKPFMYATALDNNVISPTTQISNAPISLNMGNGKIKWVRNSDDSYGGNVTIEYALKKSLNVVAMRVMLMTGPDKVVEKARGAFGFVHDLDPVPSLALGATAVSPLEMARGYSVFKNGGNRVEPYFVLRVIGPDGNELKKYEPKITQNVFTHATARTMDTLLHEAANHGTGAPVAREGVVNLHGKTGTTNEYRDAWFCGYTNRFLGIGWVSGEVWTGNRWVNKPMKRVFGGTSVGPFWGKIVKKAQQIYGEKLEPFERYFMKSGEGGVIDTDEALDEEVPTPGTQPIKVNENEVVPPIEDGGTSPTPIDDQPDEKPEEPTQPDELKIVYVEVCTLSGAKSTIYCPETANRPFLEKSAPRTNCPLHKPPQ